MGSRFERPDTSVLTLANGDTLTVKRRLNAGERRVWQAMRDRPTLYQIATVVAYLITWSLVDDAGVVVPIQGASREALVNTLDALTDESFDEIYAVITAHVAAMKAERDAEKNDPAGAIKSSVISPSAAA